MGPARVRWYACDTRPGSVAPFFVGKTARLRLCGDGGCGARFGFAAGLPGPGQEFGDAVIRPGATLSKRIRSRVGAASRSGQK
jgi:hypothetical protein